MFANSRSSIFLLLSLLIVSLSLISCDSNKASENSAPEFGGEDTVLWPENRVFSHQLTAIDKDGDTLVYNIVGGDDAERFNMDSLTGEFSALRPFDYEKPSDADGDGRFELAISVSDLINPPAVQRLSIVVVDEQNLASTLLFPADQSQVGMVETIMVVGTLIDMESGEESSTTDVQGAAIVTVNGIEATFDSNHAGLWSATVPVHQGKTPLNISVTDASGTEHHTEYEVFSHDHILANAAFSMNSESGLFYIADDVNDAIYSFNPENGEVTRVAELLDDELALPSAMQLDPQGMRLVFLDTVGSSLFVADLTQGVVSVVTDDESTLNGAVDMTMDWAQNRAFVADSVGVATVDLATGVLQYLYEFATDDAFVGVNSLLFDSNQQRLLFLPAYDRQQLDNGIYSLDIETSNVALVSEDDGNSSSDARIAAFDGSDRVWLVSYDRLVEVDLETGERKSLHNGYEQPMSSGLRGSTQALYEPQNHRLLFAENGQTGIHAYDLTTGEISEFADPQQPVALGEKMGSLRSLAIDIDRGRAICIDGDPTSIWSISIKDGARTKLVDIDLDDPIAGGLPMSARLDASGENLYFLELLPNIDADRSVIYKVDIARQVVAPLYHSADLFRDTGIADHTFVLTPSIAIDNVNQRLLMSVEFDGRTSLYWYSLLSNDLSLLREDVYPEQVQSYSLSELDLDKQRVIAGDWHVGIVTSIDLETGEVQTIVADNDGREPELQSIASVALDAPRNRALVADRTLEALIWVDLNSGEREVLSGLGVGRGPGFSYVDDIALDQKNQRAFLRGGNSLMMVNLITGDRAIVSN